MEKINFVNNSEPYLSAENLNQMQDNMENAINGFVLYENETGYNASITLSDSAANYKYIEIFFQAENVHSSLKINDPNGKDFVTQIIVVPANSQNYFKTTKWYISGTSMLIATATNYLISSSLAISDWGTSSQVYITKVVGYK